ncbi:Asp/Glu racemase [Kiloniella sp.]|uniref:maleate cis-trans isomerase family protein n=1 Tax=Kiloniella sp. TaxID=1938587 RepID=UPI003B01EF29
MHFTRAPIPDSITMETLSAQADDLARAAQTLLPDGSLDVISYACTSGSLVIGEERVFTELRKGAPSAIATSLITGVIRALRAINVRRISVATPYLDSINDAEAEYLEKNGFEICNIGGLNLEKDSEMVRVKPSYIADYAASLDHKDAEAVFISCGALRSLEIVDALEKRLGKPVIVSNQAMMWDSLRLAGINDRIEGAGGLFLNH